MFDTTNNYSNQPQNFLLSQRFDSKQYHSLAWQRNLKIFKMYCCFFLNNVYSRPTILQYPFLYQARLPIAGLIGFPKLKSARCKARSISFINCIRTLGLFFDSYLRHHVTFLWKYFRFSNVWQIMWVSILGGVLWTYCPMVFNAIGLCNYAELISNY